MKVFEGVVVSAKMLKTVVVEVTWKTPHPLYKKLLKRSKKYKVDTGSSLVSVGDKVKIIKTRPLSKGKHFRISYSATELRSIPSDKLVLIKETTSSSIKKNEEVVAKKTSRKKTRRKK